MNDYKQFFSNVHAAGRRGLSNLSAHRGPQPEDQDVDQDGRERGVWHGVSGKQEMHSSVGAWP